MSVSRKRSLQEVEKVCSIASDSSQDTKCYLRDIILNQRDLASETLLDIIVSEILTLEGNSLTGLGLDERNNLILKKTVQHLQTLSPAIALKLMPLAKSIVEKSSLTMLDHSLASIFIPPMNLVTKSLIYRRMINKLLGDDNIVSFGYTNARLVHRMSARDVFLLTLFSFVTCKRSRNDELGMIFVSGRSSVGKSILLESVIATGAHQLVTGSSKTTDPGCGRYDTRGKNILLLRDCSVNVLLSTDMERIKTLARSEPTVAKIHSSTQTLEPIFLFVSSNERLHTHKISGSSPIPQIFASQLSELAKKKKIPSENVAALKNRFIEMYIRNRPNQLESDLNHSDGFERNHFILAMIPQILDILEKNPSENFPSKYLRAYVVAGLEKYMSFYTESFNDTAVQDQWLKFQHNSGIM